MADDIARLGFDIDSAPAGSAARELLKLDAAAAAVAASTAKMEAAGRGANGRFRSMSKFARENADSVRRLASEFNSGMAAQLNYASAVERLTEAIRLGVVADNEKEAAMERLKAQYLGNASAVEAIRQKYIPLYAASQQLEQSQREIEQAMKQGWLTAAQGEAALERLKSEYIATSAGASTYANSMRRVNNIQSSVGNQFAQLNDIVVTSWGGMSPALIGMQQGMQMVQGYAGQSLPQALATLRVAFAQLLNPTTLIVVGLTAGTAALIQWGMSAIGSAGDTKALKNAMDSLEESTSELQRYTDLLNKSYAELRGEFGENAHQARELFKVMSMLSQLEAMDRMVEVTEAVSDNFEDMAQRIERINFAKLENAERVVARQQRLLNEEMGVTEDQARSLLSAQNAVNDAITSTEKLSAMRGLFDAIVAVRDETGKVPDALRPLAIEIGRAIERMQILETRSSDAEEATRSIFEVAVSGDWLDPAIKQASVLANMLYTDGSLEKRAVQSEPNRRRWK